MSELIVPRKQVLMCALCGNMLKMRKDDKCYRIDPHDALERMINGYDTYELTTVSVRFTGEVDIDRPEVADRITAHP